LFYCQADWFVRPPAAGMGPAPEGGGMALWHFVKASRKARGAERGKTRAGSTKPGELANGFKKL
jgi:hypothetical protein